MMDERIHIEPMTAVWVPQVAALEPLCFSTPWSEAGVATELENPVSRWFVAVEDGQVRGYAGSHQVMDESEVMNIATDPAHRRRGIAEALLRHLCAVLAETEAEFILLEVRESNAPARALYEKLGFYQVGKRPHYYSQPDEAGIIMRKELRDEHSGH